MNADNRKKVYDVLRSQTGYQDSYEDFNKAFDNDVNARKKVYDVLKSQTGYQDSYEDFDRLIGPTSLAQSSNTGQPVTGSVAQQVIDEYDATTIGKEQPSVISNNVDDLPQSERSPYVRGKGKDVHVFGVPYEDYQRMSPDEQSAAYQRAIDTRKEEGLNQFSTYVSDRMGAIDEELNKKRDAVPAPAGASFIPSSAIGAAQRYGNVDNQERQDRYTSLHAAKNFFDDAKKVVSEAGKKGKTNFVAGVGRGLLDKGFDVDTWSMGITEGTYYNLLNKAIGKEEHGEILSSEEEMLLDAAAVNMAAQAYYSADLGRGYKAGAVTAESIPFMLQFAINPVSASGKGIAKSILNHGLRKFGVKAAEKGIVNTVARGGARVVGDAIAAAGLTTTTGIGNVAADAQRRMTGDVLFNDEQGDISYAGRENAASVGDAITKAFVTNFFENQSEMVGNYFAPMLNGVSKAINHIPGVSRLSSSKLGEVYRALKNNPTYKEFAERTQWNGAIGEYAEEVYNNLANVAIGEMSPDELVDLDQNIDTFLGVSLMSIVFGGIGAYGFTHERYQTRKNMHSFERGLNEEELARWSEVKQIAANNDVEGVREFVKAIIKDEKLSPEEKKEEIQYISNAIKLAGIQTVSDEQTEDTVEKETANIINFSDPSTGIYTEANRFVTDETGERISVPGYIVGYIGDAPIWQAEGSDERVTLKPGELDEDSVQSMPAEEVIGATAGMIREEAQAQAERESKYSPDIIPPSVGATFGDGIRTYEIVQQNPDGGWIVNATATNEKGKQVQQVIPMSDTDYYDIIQSQIDAAETQFSQSEKSSSEHLDILAQENFSAVNQEGNIPEGQQGSLSDNSLPENSVEQPFEIAIPLDEKGNPLYHKVPVDVTIDALNREELEPDEIDAFVSANKDASAKLLKSLQDKAPKMGTNIAKYKADKLEWQGKISDAQTQVDYWDSVSDEIAVTRVQPGDKTAEAIMSMGEPLNGEELAAMMLGTGRLPILYDSYKKETGGGNAEARGMVGMFANKANGGMSIEEAGEQLMLADQENGTNFFDGNDPNAGRNAIIEVLSGARTRGDLFNFIKENRERMAERERQAEYAAYEQWCADNFHMTPTEYEAYEEVIANTLAKKVLSEADYEEFISNLVDEQINQKNEDYSRNEQTGVTGVREESDGVLQGEEVVPIRGIGETVEGTSEIDGGINSENGALPKSASGINSEIENARQEVDTNPTEAQKDAGNYKQNNETDTRRGHRLINEEINDYPNKLEVDSIIQNFKKQVNNHPEVHVLHADRDIENLSAYGANEQAISDLKEALHNKSIIAAYVRSCNSIVVFPAHALDADEIESFLWHENTHYILHNSDIKDLGTLMNACFEYIKEKKPAIYNHIIENYSQEEWYEESVTYLVQDMFNNYGADKLLKSKFAGDSSVSSLFNQLFNEIKNGKSREHNKLRQDGNVLYGTTIRQNEKGSSIRKGLEENSEGEQNKLRRITQTDGGTIETPGRESESGGRADGTEELADRRTGQKLNNKRQFPDTLSDDSEGSDGTIEAYEEAVSGRRFQAREAYQDSMLALKKLQEVIERHSGKKLQSWENAYMAENQMSSKSTYEAEAYGKKFFKPMLESVGALMNNGASYREVVDYMMAKHGLERNEVFALRDAKEASAKKFDKEIAGLVKEYKRMSIGKDEFETKRDELLSLKQKYEEEQLLKNQDKDYSGLTALTEEKKDFKANALDIVKGFEEKHETQELWDKVNAATKETLRKSYESGMMSKDTYMQVSNMFKHYIPLRGWNETTAEDVYEYLSSETSPVSSVLKSAHGRTSIADDPLATIGNMAESTILQGNRNLMKQSFLNMVVNHPSDIATMSEAWYVMDPETEAWYVSYPNIEEGDNADAIAEKLTAHAERMAELEKEGYATKVKEDLNIDYHILKRQAQEHIVTVKRNGKDYLIFINGNPRAAQAVNGLTNPDVESNKVLSGISRFNRQLAANFTTRNPAFVLSNLTRDLIFSVSAVSVKEKPLYAARFIANIPKSMAIVMRNITEVEKDRDTKDKIFEEFLANGGETGYTALHNIDEYKRMIRKEINKITDKTDYFKAIKACAGFFSMMNRWAEDVSRFNAYMTSREEGRTITEAISDAKEITVNFNKKGAGYKSGGFFGTTAGIFRNLFLFFNAGVQSLANFGHLAKKNGKGFVTLLGGFTTAGFVIPILNQLAIALIGDDGDDDYYNNLPDWVRRNNLCIYTGKGKFLTIPLPIELRAFYGLGEMAYQETIGKNGSKGDEIAYQAINQLTELLPINPLGNNGDLVTTFMPDALKPFWQINENMDFTGKPIYRENSFNENMPEWTKTYKGTSKWLVNLSEWTNELAGGDKYKKADTAELIMNWNPAKIEHLFESYFGGMAKTINQTAKTLVGGVESVIEGEIDDNIQWRNTPVANRFVNDAGDDRSSFGKINQRYYRLYDLYDDVGKNLRGYSKEVAKGNLDYLNKLEKLYESDDYKVYMKFKENKRQVDKIKKIEEELPESLDTEKKKLQLEMMKLKKALLQQLDDK